MRAANTYKLRRVGASHGELGDAGEWESLIREMMREYKRGARGKGGHIQGEHVEMLNNQGGVGTLLFEALRRRNTKALTTAAATALNDSVDSIDAGPFMPERRLTSG